MLSALPTITQNPILDVALYLFLALGAFLAIVAVIGIVLYVIYRIREEISG